MKKIFTLLCGALVAASAFAGAYVTPGTGKAYTFADLAKIDTSNVRFVDGAYIVDTVFTVSAGDTLRICNNDVIKLAGKTQINVNGVADFTPSDTAFVTVADSASMTTAKGFRLYSDAASAVVKNITFEYVGFTISTAAGSFKAYNCTFDKYNAVQATGACINFAKSSDGNVIDGCYFIEGATAAIAAGANTPCGVDVTNCYFYKNNYKNSNRPQINLVNAGDHNVNINYNTVIGGDYAKVGGIGVSNLMGYEYTGKTTVKGNVVKDNRYGVTAQGPMDMDIIDNQLVDNNHETNANNGGSGISIYDPTGKGKAYIKGNTISGNLWGITIIGGTSASPKVNMGKVEDPNAADYNPGQNFFKDNGNNGVLYDLYNNSIDTIYAQGNSWNVEKQDSASIETVVYHKADKETLGLVIFMPAYEEPTAINDVKTNGEVADVKYYNILGEASEQPFQGLNIIVTRYTNGTISSRKVMQ